MAALWDLSDDTVPPRRTPRRRRATVDGDDWAPPTRKAVNAGALAGKRGALADGHYDALLTVGVRRDATVDKCTAALRQAAVTAGLDTIESEQAGYVRASGVVLRAGDARCELQLCCVGSRRVAAVAVWLRVEIKQCTFTPSSRRSYGDNIATHAGQGSPPRRAQRRRLRAARGDGGPRGLRRRGPAGGGRRGAEAALPHGRGRVGF